MGQNDDLVSEKISVWARVEEEDVDALQAPVRGLIREQGILKAQLTAVMHWLIRKSAHNVSHRTSYQTELYMGMPNIPRRLVVKPTVHVMHMCSNIHCQIACLWLNFIIIQTVLVLQSHYGVHMHNILQDKCHAYKFHVAEQLQHCKRPG